MAESLQTPILCCAFNILDYCLQSSDGLNRYTGVLISPEPDILPDVFYLMVRIFRLMLVLLHMYIE